MVHFHHRGATFSLAAPLHRAVCRGVTARTRSQPRHGARRGRSLADPRSSATPSMARRRCASSGRHKRSATRSSPALCRVPCWDNDGNDLHRFRPRVRRLPVPLQTGFHRGGDASPDRRGMPWPEFRRGSRCRRADRRHDRHGARGVLQTRVEMSVLIALGSPAPRPAATRSSCSPAPITVRRRHPFRG